MKEIACILAVLLASAGAAILAHEFANTDPHGLPIEVSLKCPACQATCEPQVDYATGRFNKTWRCAACNKYFRE